MNAFKKKYKYSGKKKKKFLGGAIGTALGAVGGSFIGQPMLGAKVGGSLGSATEGLIRGDSKEQATRQPVQPIDYASSSYGFAGGGFLNNAGQMMLPQKKNKKGRSKKKATGGKVDSGGRQFKKKKKDSVSDVSYNQSPNAMVEHYVNNRLKNGEAKSIGQDAIEFEGNNHENGGIDIDQNTEVEGKETMDSIGGSDYVFSKRLKVPGTYDTFAEAHKQMINNNADPAAIQRLAELQEKVSGRK